MLPLQKALPCPFSEVPLVHGNLFAIILYKEREREERTKWEGVSLAKEYDILIRKCHYEARLLEKKSIYANKI